ncbi:hypothetical protein BH20ACT6_BH20ACT6_08540 [soil metagenome]
MKRMTTRTAAAGVVLVLGSLAGCSGDDAASSDQAAEEASSADEPTSGAGGSNEEYCAALKDAKAEFEALEGSNPDSMKKLDSSLDTMRELGDKSPDEVSSEWKTLVSGIDQLEQAVQDAGLTLDQLSAISENPDPKSLPKGVTIEKVQKLGVELQQLNSEQMSQAQDKIDANAQQECGITLSDNPGEEPTQ